MEAKRRSGVSSSGSVRRGKYGYENGWGRTTLCTCAAVHPRLRSSSHQRWAALVPGNGHGAAGSAWTARFKPACWVLVRGRGARRGTSCGEGGGLDRPSPSALLSQSPDSIRPWFLLKLLAREAIDNIKVSYLIATSAIWSTRQIHTILPTCCMLSNIHLSEIRCTVGIPGTRLHFKYPGQRLGFPSVIPRHALLAPRGMASAAMTFRISRSAYSSEAD